MTDINIHRVKKIHLEPIEIQEGACWRSIKVETDEGKFEFTMFGNQEDLNIEVSEVKKI